MTDKAEQFFYQHACYSWDPATETRHQGRMRCAQQLAAAEAQASADGMTFQWYVDDVDSSEWSDERPAWQQWVCVARDATGRVVASLGVIDFGRDGEPWGNPYQRVVEAELALEALAGGGHNSAGSEAPAMRDWALRAFPARTATSSPIPLRLHTRAPGNAPPAGFAGHLPRKESP